MAGEIQLITPEDIERARQASKNELGRFSGTQYGAEKEGAPKSRYEGINYNFFENPEEVAGRQQGALPKLGNGLAKMGVTALSSGVENTIGLFNGIGQMVTNAVDNDPSTSITEGLWNNATGKSVDAINLWAKDAFPTYYTEAQQKMGVESLLPGSGNAINWWSDKFLGGAGYMLGAVGSGMLASGLLKGASSATAKNLLKQELSNAAKSAAGTTSASLVEKGGLGIVMAHGESSVEARDIKKNTYDKLIAQGIDPVEAEKISSAAGNVGYAVNMALVGGTDISMFGKSLMGWRGLKQESKYLGLEGGKAVAKLPGKIDKYLPAIEGFGKEFGQEVGQLGTQKGVEDFYLRQHEISSFNDAIDVMGSIVGETIKSLGTNEGWESGLLGGFLGAPAGALQSRGATDEEYKRAQIAADVINTGFKNIQNTKENLLQSSVSGKMAEQNLKDGQKDKFYDNKHDEFKGYVKTVEENGGTDVLIQQIESMKQAPIEEVRQFFQIPAQYNFDEQIKTQKINDAIKEIKQIADVHRKIKENYPTAPKPVFDALFDAATALDNTSKRVSELSGELSAMSNGALSFSELEYKNDKEYRDSFNREAKKVIDNVRQINPAGADEIIEKMKALKYLTLERRDKYVKQWEEAVKNPDKIVEQAKTVEEKAKAISETPIAPKPIDTGDVEANRRNKLSNDIIAEEPGLNSEEKLAAAKQKLIDIDNYGVELNKAFPQEAESNKKEEEKLRKLIQDRIKKYEERILELKHSDKSILHGVSRIGSIFNFRFKRDADGKIIGEEWLTPIADLVKIANVKWQDINSKTTLSYEEYNVPGEIPGAIKRLADTDMFPEDYPAGIRTGIKVGDKYYSIAMKVDGIQYGWLLDPDRFQFLENGKYVSFNPNSLDHLRMLNSRFVTTDENGQVVPSAEGFEYIREYKNLMNAFDVLRTKISKGEPISLLDIQDYANLIPQNYFFASAPKEATKFLDERAGKFTTEFKGKTFGPLILDRKNKVFWEYKDGVFTELDKETSGDLLDEFLRNSKVKNSIDALSNDYLAVLGMDGAKNPTVLTLKYAKLQDVQDISKDIVSAIKDITENPNKDIKEITKDKGIFVAGNLNKDSFGAPVTLNIEVKSTKGEKPKLVLNVYSTKNSTGIPRADIALNQVSKSYPYIKTEGDSLTLVKGTTETPITNSQELIAAVNVITENWIRNAKRKADSKLTLSKNDQLVSTLFTKELGEIVPLRITSLQQRPETNSQNLAGATIDSELITTLNLRGKDESIEKEPAIPLSDFFGEEPIKKAPSDIEAKKADIERRRPTSYIRDSKDKKSPLETFRNEAKREWDGVSVITGDRMKNLYVGIQLFVEAYPEHKDLLDKFIKKENGTIGITNNNLSFVLNTLKKQGVTTESELGVKINAKYDAEIEALTKQEPKPTVSEEADVAKKADIERRRQEELNQKHDAGYSTIALDYLFTGGRDVILSTDYLLQALVGGFTNAATEINNIRNKYADKLGNIKDDINSDVYNQMMNEIRDVINKNYNDSKATEIFDKILKNATGFTNREGNQTSIELDKLNEQNESKINAKYDAELAALEQPKAAFTSDDFKGDEIAKEATEQFGDVFGIFEPQKPSATKEGEETAFKLSEEVGEDRDLIEAIGNLEDILDIQSESNPNGKITIKEFDEINKNVKSKNYSWGRLIGNVIELSKKRGKGVEYHEAFHAIFRVFLNKSEIQQAYKDARKKYGEPKNLDEFRAEHPSRYSLSKSELGLLWLEEQMADDYQQHKIGSKNIFQKIFDKIKNLVQSIFNSVSGIDQLFSKIDSGYYKTAQPRTDVVYFPGQAFKLMKDSDGKYLNPSINEKVISKVLSEALVIKLTKGFLEPADIKEIVSVLNTKFYNARVFKDALLRIKDGEPGVEGDENLAKSKAREIVRIQLALKQPENQELLYETISERIATTGFPVEDIDTSAEEDSPMIKAMKDTSEKGGYNGTSQRLREWLSSIRVPSDDFELNLTDAELSNPVHQNFVNPYQLYNALDRALVNTKRENILQRFEIISRTNKNLRAAYSRLVKDVAADLEIPLDGETILQQDFTTLSGSGTFNMFISNFTTMRADRIKPLIDPESNMVKVIRSNINDIQDIQVNEWKGNWFYKNLDNKLSQVSTKLAAITKNFNKTVSFYNPLQQVDIIKEIKSNFEQLGILLDDNYIRYSVVNNTMSDLAALKQLQDNEEFQKLKKELELFPEVGWITNELLSGLEQSVSQGGFYKSVDAEDGKGAESRLKKIALGNSIFDESVVPTTVRNIEGKIVYLNLKPNYYLYESFLWRDGKRLAAFKEGKLQEEMIADGNYMSDWQFNLYNQAIKYNHWLNAENADVILKNFRMFVAEGLSKTHLDKEFNVEEFRESIEKTYADTDQASTYLIMLSQFSKAIPERVVNNFRITDNKQDFAPFMLVQTEGKNTQYPVLAPVGDFSSGTKLNQKALDILSDYMKQEFERIQNVKKGLGVKIEKVNISEKDRGYDYFNFKSIKAIDEAGYNELKEEWNKEKAQELIEKDINQKFQDFLSELKKNKLITDENTSTFLPDYFRNVDKVLNDRLFTFFINQYVNSLAFNNLMFGDSAINFKSFLDEVKRMAGPNANGPSLGSATTNVDIIKDIEIDGINTTDAQSYATPDWFLNKYLKGLGKSNKEVDKIIKKVIRGYELTNREVEILNKNASLVNPKKTAVFNQSIYGKTSTHTLLRSVTSEAIDRKQLDVLYDLIDNNQAYEGIQDDINALWRPVSGREELHEQLNDMYSKGIEVRFRQSAIKTQMVLNTPFIVSDNYIREQVVTDGMKDEIVSGVQYTQLISGEQGEGEATIGDAKVSFKELGRQFEALMGIKQSKTYKLFQQLLFPKGNFSEKYIAKLFEKSLDRNEQDILLKAFLVSDHTGFKHNINRLTTLKKAENIFNAITNAITFRQKNAGHKLTLVSDAGYGVIRDEEGKVIPAKRLKQGERGTKDRLSYKFDKEKNIWYAEAIISAQLASQLGYVSGKAFEFVGVRIPTQDKHSMINLRVVDVLPAETGNCCILPHEIIRLAGSDFDIDSEFLNGASYYEKNKALGFFGDYYTAEKKYEQAFEEYLEGAKIYDERFNIDYKEGLKANEEYKALKAKILQYRTDIAEFGEFSDEDVNKLTEVSIEALGSDIKDLATKQRVKQALLDKLKIEQATADLVLKGLGYKTTLEEFKEKYTSQVDRNIQHFKKAEFDKIQPLSVGELNNALWEISKYLVMNKGNEKIANTSATRFIADEFRDKYFKTGIFKDPGALKDINSPQSIVKAKWLNSVGEAGVGVPALSNIAFNYLIKGDVRGYTDYVNSEGQRINDINSAFVSIFVDAAKENDPIYLNLTEDNTGAVLNTMQRGMNPERALLLNVQPAMIELINELNADTGQIFKKQGFDTISKAILEKHTGGKQIELSDENLVKAKVAFETNNFEAISKEEYNFIQYAAIENFLADREESELIRNLNPIISLAKGIKPTFAEMAQVDKSIEALGIINSGGKAVSGKPKNDIYKAVLHSPFLTNLVEDYWKFKKDSANLFIVSSDFASNVIKEVKDLVKESKIGNEEFNSKLNLALVAFLQTKKLQFERKGLNVSDILTLDPKVKPLYIEQFEKLQKDPYFGKNRFIKSLKYSTYPFTKGALAGKYLHKISMPSRIRKDAYYQGQMMDAVEELFKNPENIPQESADLAKDFIKNLLRITTGKDAGLFKNESFSEFVRPNLTQSVDRALNSVVDVLQKDKEYEKEFGLSKEELFKEAIETIARDYSLQDVFKTEDIKRLKLKKTPEGLSGEMDFIPPRFIYNFAYNPITDARVYEIYKRNTYTVVKEGEGTKFPVTYTKVFFVGHKDINAAAFDLNTWKMINDTKPVVKKKAEENKYEKQIAELYADVIDLPGDIQKQAIELIKSSKITTDEEMGDLINKICNLGK